MIAYNEESNIADCLHALSEQNYKKGKFEILVVDGMSQDNTPNIVTSFVQRYGFMKLIINPGRTVSSNRNVGIGHASYPYIAFTDADCICPPDWLEKLTDGYLYWLQKGIKVGAVGGGNISDDQFGKVSSAIGIAFNSTLSALGSQQTRLWNHDKEVESLAGLNVLYAKSVFDEVGLFDESQTNTAEDWIFNYNVRAHGYRLFYIKNATILHKMRTTMPRFVKQMYVYGLGRGTVIRRNPRTLTWRYAAPLLFLAVMILSLPCFALTGSYWFILPYLYFPITVFYSIYLCLRKKRMDLFPLVFLIYLTIHFVYSCGEWKGLAGD
ncbi:glycosyltransferase [Paenibacillus thermotolerans]|uniref:glycosyltransferase n=1 Tax=Paenibacillus thermotolerans TaxID=3027807 RepID=UPI003CC5BF64